MQTVRDLVGCIAATALSCALPAFAQSGLVLEEVIVTAQKKSETLSDTPITVNVVTGEQLAEFASFSLEDVNNLTAGLAIVGSGFDTDISTRGVGTELDAGVSPRVTIYYDGAFVSQQRGLFSAIYDLERFEILRGPQGTLYGKASPAGALTIQTRSPNMSQMDGYIQQSFSERSGTNTQFGVSLPLIEDTLSLRVAGLYDRNRNSDIVNITNDNENENETSAMRAVLSWQAGENFDLRVGYHRIEDEFDIDQNAAGNGIRYDQRIAVNDHPSTMENSMEIGVLEMNYSLPNDWTLTSVSSLQDNTVSRQWDGDGSPVQGQVQYVNSMVPDVWNTELRLSSQGDNDFWDWTVGAYYQESDSQTPVNVNTWIASGPSSVLRADTTAPAFLSSEDLGIFTHNAFHLTEAGTLTVGLRYIDQKSNNEQPFVTDIFVLFPDSDVLVATLETDGVLPEEQDRSEDAWTGTLKYQHRFNDDFMAYASYDRGWRGGAANIAGAPQPPVFGAFNSESSDNVELGIKLGVLDGRGLINLTAYYQVYNNFQYQGEGIAFRQPSIDGELGGTDLANPVVNVEEVESYGFDADMTILLSDSWSLNAALTYNKTTFSSATGVPCTTGGPVPEEDWAFNTCDLTGERADKLPEWSTMLNSEYQGQFGTSGNEWYVRGLLNAESEYFSQSLAADLDSYVALDLFIGARSGGGTWDVSLWVKNATDETAMLKAIRFAPVPDYENGGEIETGLIHVQRQLAPRTVGLTFRLNFGV